MSADQAEHGHQVSEREARQVAEEAREADWTRPSFGKQLFLGKADKERTRSCVCSHAP